MTVFQKLSFCLQQLQSEINKFSSQTSQSASHIQQIFEQIQIGMEENINKTMEILQSSSRSLGFTLTIINLSSESHFDINSQFSVNYRNLKFTGNQKQVIVNQEINQKFVLPILQGKQMVLVEIWKIEGQHKQVFNTFQISLRDIIGLESDSNTYTLTTKSLKQPQIFLNYTIQVRGFGFESWKKHHQQIDQQIINNESQIIPNQTKVQEVVAKKYQKAEVQKNSINKIFQNRKQFLKQAKLTSFDQNLSQIDDIMNLLDDI